MFDVTGGQPYGVHYAASKLLTIALRLVVSTTCFFCSYENYPLLASMSANL